MGTPTGKYGLTLSCVFYRYQSFLFISERGREDDETAADACVEIP